MNTIINPIHTWLNAHPKTKQWMWFIVLWLGGLATVSILTYPIKWLMKTITDH